MKTILVIEDEKPVLTGILILLKAESFQAFGAENGTVGLQMVQEHRPDLIICDIMMPALDGYGILSELRRQQITATIPLIFLTAKATKDDLRQGMQLGADDYLTKPFTREELLGSVAAQLTKQEVIMQYYSAERQKAKDLEEKVQELHQLNDAKDRLLCNLCQELRNPLSNINMAIEMLKVAPPGSKRDRYLDILHKEFAREISLLNQVSELQRFLTPESVSLLSLFNLLKKNPN